MAGDEESKERGFTIVDRRGEETEREAPASDSAAKAQETPGPLPPVDFSSFVLSLATSALYHMGLVADPQTGQHPEPDLPLARQTVDTLALLEEKTRGNLTDDEQKLLESVLAELRLRYVESDRE